VTSRDRRWNFRESLAEYITRALGMEVVGLKRNPHRPPQIVSGEDQTAPHGMPVSQSPGMPGDPKMPGDAITIDRVNAVGQPAWKRSGERAVVGACRSPWWCGEAGEYSLQRLSAAAVEPY